MEKLHAKKFIAVGGQDKKLQLEHRLSQVLLREHEVPVRAMHALSSHLQSGKWEPSGKHAHSAPIVPSPLT